jgi:hypothetical protein
MNGVVRAGITGAVSLCLAFLLYGIVSPESGAQPTARESERLAAEPVYFQDAILVDYLAGLGLQSEIERVRWNYSVLSVDLSVGAETGPAAVYGDLAALARFCFDGTKNVRHLLVRVVEDGKFLLGMNGTREQWEAVKPLPEDPADRKKRFDAYFSMKYSEAWEIRTARSEAK